MKNKILFILLVLCTAFILCTGAYAMEGSGTESDPYIIKTVDDFMAINNNKAACYRLEEDLELPTTTTHYIKSTFTGVFDGGGHSINVDIRGNTNTSSDTFNALFAVVTGQIKNLTVTGVVEGSNKVAGIVGKLEKGGKIDNCVNKASVFGRKNVAGIAGVLFDQPVNGKLPGTKITNCANLGDISGYSIKSGVDMGGIVGCVWYTTNDSFVIEGCYNEGTVSVTEGQSGLNVGGIVGYFDCGRVKNCFNAGYVKSSGASDHGSIFGKTDGDRNHIDGYISLIPDSLVGLQYGTVIAERPYMLESDGVAIYLGQGSGIRGEFHFPKALFDFFASVSSFDLSGLEYGCVVSTKDVVEALGGDLLSSEANDSGLVVFAPAMKNQNVIYSYLDEARGEAYHSYRFALTGFPDNGNAYNKEFVILGYVKVPLANGEEQVYYINTVKSERLAKPVENTEFNSVSIFRVADVTLKDGDFNGNQAAINALAHITSFITYANEIEIDGVVNYGHSNASFTSAPGSDGTMVFKITSTLLSEVWSYVNELKNNGYTLYSENEIEGNYYYTFKKGSTLLNIAYWANVLETTITVEEITALPGSVTQPSYNKTNDPSITQIKLQASISEGMSYVIHLSDGTFLIIDGGWCDANGKEADRLYDTLVALAGEGNDIVIAGWIFTHCHGDHIGTFNFFVNKYHDYVRIRQLLYNFPADADIAASGSAYMLNDTPQRYVEFRRVIAQYLQDTEYVKLHSGYKFYYADAEIEILQTHEDIYPRTVANYDFNSSSTIFTVTVAGQKMMFLGDVSDTGASRLNSVYDKALKSDFLQIAHHGLNNGDVILTLYKKVNPTYVLYPSTLAWYESNEGSVANSYVAYGSKKVKQLFLSDAQTVELYLPYDGKLFDGEKFPGMDIEVVENEVARPETYEKVPDAYFDLDLSGGTATDAMGNATVTVKGGEVTETTVEYDGKESTVTAFTGDRNKELYYMTLNFNDIKTDAQMGEFIMGSTTFEIFMRLDTLPGQTVGLITSCNSGGVTLYLRKQAGGQLTFQIGSTAPNSNGFGNYSSPVDMNGSSPRATDGELLHIVGSYDSKTNLMKLYINGVLVGSADFGTGEYRDGMGNDCVIGIGYNPQYSGEAISSYADYEVFEAKIYNTALTDKQVAQEYWNCIDNLIVMGE